MLPYYNKHTIEVAITKPRSKLLASALYKLRKVYSPIVNSTLKQLPGGDRIIAERDDDIREWFDTPERDDILLEILTLKDSEDLAFFIELKDMNTLQTSFGKKHHKKNRACLVIYSFAMRLGVDEQVNGLLDNFAKILHEEFRLKKKPEVSSIVRINDNFEALRKKRHSTDPIPSDILPALELFKDTDFRATLIRTRQAKDPTFQNIVKSTGLREDKVRFILLKGTNEGILIRQYNCICPSCGNTLARVANKTAITQMAKAEVSCPSCRTNVSDDSCVDCFVVAERYVNILEGSKWLTMYVRHKLMPFLTASRELASVVNGPNELDLVINVDGSFMLVELKDNRFSIGHAYSFVGKCSQYQPDISLIIATNGIDDDVKEYIKNIGIKVHYVENIERLDPVINDIFSQQNGQTFAQLVGEVAWNRFILRSLLSIFGVEFPVPEEPYRLTFGQRFFTRSMRRRVE
ncbi:MAG: hypothetical protein ACFFCW_24270 [Candidatus Hodarchaeota archaeon]